ncbi:MAG TPA: hypothetical protein VN829_02265 [Dongiaceae bacterium]|nr:hypothetical protein [Dongiaceae bacterium]
MAVLATKGSRFVVLYDGVEGPRIEALLTGVMGGIFQTAAYWTGQVPILFSNDGSHWAYSAKMGDEFVVMLDGKELARGPINPNTQANVPLTFSEGGKHLYYMDADAQGKYRIVVDGKPGPAVHVPPQLVLSPGGQHYAYLGYERSTPLPNWAVVDGRQVNFFGDNLQYTGLGVLVSRMSADGAAILVLNGKPSLKAARLDPMWISPDGHEIAIDMIPKSGDPSVLTVNGKLVPETQGLGVTNVYFSPDGKRYAALCNTKAGANFMIIDGKKGEEYQSIAPHCSYSGGMHWMFVNGVQPTNLDTVRVPVPGFTPDSSKFVYVAGQGALQFLIVDDQESNGFRSGMEPILSPVGNRIGAIGVAANGNQHVIIDGKDQAFGPTAVAGGGRVAIHDLSFTADGSRCAYVNGAHLSVDGVLLPGLVDGAQFTFSPDDKHVLYLANDGGSYGVFIDGKIVDTRPGNLAHPFFSPDSRHVFWMRMANYLALGTKDSVMLYVDGKQATHYSDSGVGGGVPVNFEFSSDGAMVFVARTDGNLRRFRVTLPSDTNVDTVVAAAAMPKDRP